VGGVGEAEGRGALAEALVVGTAGSPDAGVLDAEEGGGGGEGSTVPCKTMGIPEAELPEPTSMAYRIVISMPAPIKPTTPSIAAKTTPIGTRRPTALLPTLCQAAVVRPDRVSAAPGLDIVSRTDAGASSGGSAAGRDARHAPGALELGEVGVAPAPPSRSAAARSSMRW
jgi:hypothetical protein